MSLQLQESPPAEGDGQPVGFKASWESAQPNGPHGPQYHPQQPQMRQGQPQMRSVGPRPNRNHRHGPSNSAAEKKQLEDVAFSVANAALMGLGSDDSQADPNQANNAQPNNNTPAANNASSALLQRRHSQDYGHSHNQNNGSIKVFVGQVPTNFEESNLVPIFEPYGPLDEVIILRDKFSGRHKGCAFVKYKTLDAAHQAINALHDRMALGPNKGNIIVKLAKSPNSPPTQSTWKIFVGMLGKDSDEDRIRQMFEPYGPVLEVYVMRDHAQQSKGCAFVKYGAREHAIAAIANLHDKVIDEGASRPLNVKFANNQGQHGRQRSQSHPPLHNYFGAMNMQDNQNPQQQQPQHQQQHQQQPRNTPYQHLQGFGNGLLGGPNTFGYHMSSGAVGQPKHGLGSLGPDSLVNNSMMSNHNNGYVRDRRDARGPNGANLFVYNIPENYGDMELASLFTSFGTILSTRVFMDKNTGASKGFGFVSFADPEAAEKAITVMNGYELGNKRLKVAHKANKGQQDKKFVSTF